MEEKEFYRWLQVLIFHLQLPAWPFEEKINRENALVLIANFFALDPKDPELPQKAFLKLSEILAEKEIAPSIPPNLRELVKIYEEHLKEVQGKQLVSAFPTLNEEIKVIYEKYRQAIAEESEKEESFKNNPSLLKAVSHEVALAAVTKIPPTAHPQAFEETVSPEEYQKLIQESVGQNLARVGIKPPPEIIKIIAEKTRPLAKTLAATPRLLSSVQKHPSLPIPEKIPPEITAKLTAEPEGVAFRPIFTLLHPPTAVSFAKKFVLIPIVKTFQWAIKITEEVSPEIKLAILEGLTSKDIQESVNTLKEAGLPANHPKLDQLKNQQDQLAKFESSHKVLSFFLRHYHEFSKITGGRQIQESQIGLFLPQLSPSPTWDKQKGYTWFLRQRLNRIGTFLRTHQWMPAPSGKKIIHFALLDKIVRLFSFGRIESFSALKTVAYKKIVKPVLIWLGKTAIGKAIKAGAKKLITWGLTKLGLAAIPEPVISKALLILSFAKDILSLGKRLLKRLLEKPELALIWGIALIGLPILLPMIPILGFALTAVGIISAGIGLLAKAGQFLGTIAGKIGGFLTSAANTIGGFFSSLSTISLPSILPAIAVGGTVGTIAFATIITVITTGSAFIEKGIGERPPHIGTPVNPRLPVEAGHLAETVIWALNQCGITSVNENTWEETENCLKTSSFPNKEETINQFNFSVFKVGPGLQCVGFVRGVMAALGKDPGGGRHANGYLDLPTPSGYHSVNTNMEDAQIGDLVIMKGTTYGHIGIVVNEKDNYIWVAQAWGTENGLLQITEINSAYFDGFLRPQ